MNKKKINKAYKTIDIPADFLPEYDYKSVFHILNIIIMNNLVTVNVSEPNYEDKLAHKELKLTGEITLDVLEELNCYGYDYLDISEAEFGIDYEKWEVCLGWSHSGPVYGNSGYRKVEVLRRLLEEISAKAILLPDDVQRRHINSAKKNYDIKQLEVRENCRLFAYEDGKLMNKKKTTIIFNSRL